MESPKVDYSDLIERLKSDRLSQEDKTVLERLVNQAAEAAAIIANAPVSEGGRKIVARLPHGMDIVK